MCLINYLNFLVQDPGTPPAKRIWTSIDTQTEIFVSAQDEVAWLTASGFDVILSEPKYTIQKTSLEVLDSWYSHKNTLHVISVGLVQEILNTPSQPKHVHRSL